MIYGYLYQGSGAGNQLFRYIMTRTKALDLGVDYRMIYVPDSSGKAERFKCKDFIEFDESKLISVDDYHLHLGLYSKTIKNFNEKKVIENGVDIRGYDPEINFVEDNTIIDGEFQDERYWGHRLPEIREWLKVEPLEMPDDLCVINIRGGEFRLFPDLFLTREYWDKCIEKMKQINSNMKFIIHTDDLELANTWFPEYQVVSNIELNWRSIRFAKYLILSNSSFAILPALLGNAEYILAPRWWGRHNTKVWSLSQNWYKRFTYVD